MGEPFDLSAYIDSLGAMTPEQRVVLDDAMATIQGDGDNPEFLRDAVLYLTTLVLVGGVTTFDNATWQVIDTFRNRHLNGVSGAGRSSPESTACRCSLTKR